MDVMAIAGNGMQQDLLRLETISQNMANVLTPGYKKQVVVGQPFAAQVDGAMAHAGHAAQGGTQAMVRMSIDPSAGTQRYTGNMQDVTIDGDGFFEIAGQDGPAYTRQSNLRADVGGLLVGSQGLPVMGAGGEIVLTGGAFTVDRNGDVRQGDRLAGHIKVVRFANPEALQPVGGGLYAQGSAQLATQGRDGTIHIGFQENSNVNSPQEMVRLTETVRHFEALQKIMQGYDDSLDQTIRKLGEF